MTGLLDGQRERPRLEALRSFEILDSAPEAPYDDVAALAAALLDAPMATVTFVDTQRQWFKAAIGLDLRESARSEAFCARTIDGTGPFVVEDAHQDEHFAASELVTGASAVRAYAGAPIVTDAGFALGAVAVFDRRPRRFSSAELAGLERLARLTMRLLEERRHRSELHALTAARHHELRSAHELVLSHLDNTPLAVVEWDETFQVRRWTRGAEAVFGWSTDEVLGKAPEAWAFVHPDDAERVRSIMDDLLTQRTPRNVSRNCNLTRDGRVITCDWYNSVVPVPGGGMSILSLVEDVTDDVEKERRSHTAQRLESVGQLTGGVAHDVNNLLTVITGNAELLEAQLEAAEPSRRLARMILDAAGRGAELVAGLLAFARRQPLSPTIRDVDVLIGDMLPILERTLGEAIALRFQSSGVFPRTASVDAHAFESALLNLVLNARDALPRGGHVVVSTRVETLGPAEADGVGAAPGRYVVTSVEDDGDGVPAELVDRVWEPFFTTKPSGTGGMGLAMVYGFARQSSGFARLRSNRGRGTVVTLALPWDGGPTERRRDDRPVTSERGSEHVLVVEDNDLVREMVQMQLASLGYTVTAVGDGPEALATIGADPTIGLVFSDVVMPGGMSGFDLAAELRRRRPDLPVLLTSGYAGAAAGGSTAETRATTSGIDLLEKPYRREDLAARVRAALRNERA